MSNISDGLSNFAEKNFGDMGNFEVPRTQSEISEFINSNSLVAKVAFLLMILILFVIFYRIVVTILANVLAPSKSPILLDGMIDAKFMKMIPSNPNVDGGKPTLRSVDRAGGTEFTWSVWIFINDVGEANGEYKHIFHKGDDTYSDQPLQYLKKLTLYNCNPDNPESSLVPSRTSPDNTFTFGTNPHLTEYIGTENKDCTEWEDDEYKHIYGTNNAATRYAGLEQYETILGMGMNNPMNGPGLYLESGTNKLVVVMNTYPTERNSNIIAQNIEVEKVPVNKWVNVIIRNRGNIMDVYINGSIVKRHTFESVPKQNYGNVYLSMNGGYDGYTSNLRYFDHALGTGSIQGILNGGPSLKMNGHSSMTDTTMTNYLSSDWYFANAT